MGFNRMARRVVSYPVNVYVPGPDHPHAIAKGSGIVAIPTPSPGLLLAYYEGNIYEASNIVTWADRCYHAASRMGADTETDYPTTAFGAYPEDALTRVGTFNGDEVTLLDDNAANAVYRWLDLHERGNMALDDECLRGRLLTMRGRLEH